MARHDATCGGTLPSHGPTLSERRQIRYAQLVKQAKTGALIVCDSEGCVTPANELIDPPRVLADANMVGSGEDANKLPEADLLFTRSKHLNDWSRKNGDEFSIVEMPMDVIEFGPQDEHGVFAYRGMVSSPYAPVAAAWTLTKPKRFQGYTEPLYLLLEVAHIAGQPIPKPREVLQAFAKEQPSQIASVTGGESLNYYLADGTTIRTANLKAIRGAIAAMTGKSQNSPA